MKKAEFLKAIKGCLITVEFIAYEPNEKGTAIIKGLPLSVLGVHKNQILVQLKESLPCVKCENSNLKYWEKESLKRDDEFGDFGYTDSYVSEAKDWVDWYERHPNLVFSC